MDLRLRPCRSDLDPGLVDRTILLWNYSEMCPPETPMRRETRRRRKSYSGEEETEDEGGDGDSTR